MELDAATAEVLRLRALLDECQHRVAALLELPKLSDQEQQMVAATTLVALRASQQSIDDCLRWVKAFLAGQQAWCVFHCADGQVDVTYFGHLSREQRAVIGR